MNQARMLLSIYWFARRPIQGLIDFILIDYLVHELIKVTCLIKRFSFNIYLICLRLLSPYESVIVYKVLKWPFSFQIIPSLFAAVVGIELVCFLKIDIAIAVFLVFYVDFLTSLMYIFMAFKSRKTISCQLVYREG